VRARRSAEARRACGRGHLLPALLAGLCFFAFVVDAYSRMIVGWQLALHADARRPPGACPVGSVGDDYDNALAESFLDSFKIELIVDRIWSSGSQPELAFVEYIGWHNAARLQESLGDIPPIEYEQKHLARRPTTLTRAMA
jgi:transposase InsO family protein